MKINEENDFGFIKPDKERMMKSLSELSPLDMFYKSIKNNFVSGIKKSIERGVDPSHAANFAIDWTFQLKFYDIVKELLKDKRVLDKLSESEKLKYEQL